MRVIVNYDLAAFVMPHLTGDDLVASLFGSADLPDSPITDLWWNIGEGNHSTFYNSDILEPSKHPRQEEMEDLGIVGVLNDETRRRGLTCGVSYRINGNDSDSGQVELPKEKTEHGEFLLDSTRSGHRQKVRLWDFQHQWVREWKLKILAELLGKWKWDVLEIDFARACPVFQPGKAWQHRDLMSDFMRDVKALCDKQDTQVCARVPETLVGCHFDGLDVETWCRSGYVDMLTVGCRSFEIGPEMHTDGVAWGGVPCYPVLDEVHSSDGYHHAPLEVYRGVIANWMHQGFDGFQCFNFQDADPRVDMAPDWDQSEWLQQRWEHHKAFYEMVGTWDMNPDAPRFNGGYGGPKTYVIQRRGGGRAPSAVSFPWDWDQPERQYCNTNPEGQLPAFGTSARLTMYVAEPGPGMLAVAGVDRTPCKVWLNNIPLLESSSGNVPREAITVFFVPADALAEGENLITIQAYTIINKVELTI